MYKFMNSKYIYAVIAFVMAGLLVGCHSKVDLENIDPQAEVEMGVALPVGSIHATIGDFLGGGQLENIYLDEDNVFHFIDTVPIPTKDYHKIDIKKYILENKKPLKFNIKEVVPATKIRGGETYVLTFDLSLRTDNFNADETEERIDSVQASLANFVSIIKVSDFDLSWSEIQKVELVLGNQFKRAEGNVINIPVKGYGYKKEIPIDVTNFSLNLIDEKKGGMVDKINFQIRFYVRPTEDIALTEDSEFSYDLKVNVVDYKAVWGFFQAGNEMRDAQTMRMDSLWEGWKDVKKLKVRFMEPIIDVMVSHRIAAPLRMYIDYISAIDSTGKATYATWDDSRKTNFDLNPSLNPYESAFTDSVVNKQRFSYEPGKGHLDQLFDVRPDFFGYSFYLLVDKNARGDYPWKQHRLTPDVAIRGRAAVDVPFKINTGSEMEYTTTLSNVDISDISLDSILASVDALDSVKTGEVKLIIEVENGMPFKIDGKFTFLNKDSVAMKMEFVEDNPDNHLVFPAPEMERPAGVKYGHVTKPSISRYIINVNKNDLNRLSQVGYIRMDVAMLDNPEPCIIEKGTDLRVRIGIAARVDAVLNFGGNQSDDKK